MGHPPVACGIETLATSLGFVTSNHWRRRSPLIGSERSAMEQRVTFNSDGETLVGTLFRPDGARGPLPTVVAGGGWCYVKEIVLPHVARIVNESGVQFLGFDYRGFGESSGERRQHIDPWQQISDYKNALSYVETRDDVDNDRLGAFGISYSGGHVLILAATDPRVKAVTSVVPVVDGWENMRRTHGEVNFAKLLKMIHDDRRARAAGEPGGMFPMSSLTPPAELSTWPFPRINEVFNQLKASGEASGHIHESTIESTELLLSYTVFPYLERILDARVLMVVAEGDNITMWDREIAALNAVTSPRKRVELLPAVSHGMTAHRSDVCRKRERNLAVALQEPPRGFPPNPDGSHCGLRPADRCGGPGADQVPPIDISARPARGG